MLKDMRQETAEAFDAKTRTLNVCSDRLSDMLHEPSQTSDIPSPTHVESVPLDLTRQPQLTISASIPTSNRFAELQPENSDVT